RCRDHGRARPADPDPQARHRPGGRRRRRVPRGPARPARRAGRPRPGGLRGRAGAGPRQGPSRGPGPGRHADARPGRRRAAGPAAGRGPRDRHHQRGPAAPAAGRGAAAQGRAHRRTAGVHHPRGHRGAVMTEAQARILLVDDDEAKRYLTGTWLRRAGHTVIEAGTGREALDLIGDAELVVLDVNLPDMTGYEVCKLIKGDPATAAIPVVQISATAVQVSDRALGLTQGADAYLTDPSEPDELLAVVMAALRYSRARQRAERTASLLAALTEVALDISAASTFDGLARAAAAGAARIFAAQAALIVQMPDGHIRRTSAMPGQPGTRQRGAPRDLADRVTARVLGDSSGSMASAAISVSREDWLALVPDATLRCDVCVAAMWPKADRPPVALAVDQAGVPGQEDLQILRQLVQLVALAADALRSYAEEHTIALTLQRSLLPSAPPEIPGLAMAFRYLPASDQAEVGGDFYEALRWRDQVLVAIGDVQGHSLGAATVMGELRHALRAFAVEGHAPLAITGLVNEVL